MTVVTGEPLGRVYVEVEPAEPAAATMEVTMVE